MKKGDEKGISSVVAVILIILIVIAAIALIWLVVLPLIKNKSAEFLQTSLTIDSLGGYTLYDSGELLIT